MDEIKDQNVVTEPVMDENEVIIEQLHKCGKFIYHRINRSRGQGGVLRILSENPNVTQKELLTILNVQPGSLSEILTKLERKGLIVRTKDGEDRRKVRVNVTEEGLVKMREREQKIKYSEALSALSTEEKEQLTSLLGKLTADWEERYGKLQHGGDGK